MFGWNEGGGGGVEELKIEAWSMEGLKMVVGRLYKEVKVILKGMERKGDLVGWIKRIRWGGETPEEDVC